MGVFGVTVLAWKSLRLGLPVNGMLIWAVWELPRTSVIWSILSLVGTAKSSQFSREVPGSGAPPCRAVVRAAVLLFGKTRRAMSTEKELPLWPLWIGSWFVLRMMRFFAVVFSSRKAAVYWFSLRV